MGTILEVNNLKKYFPVGASTSTSLSKVSYECKAGTAYYIIPKGKSASVTKIEYIEAE